MTIRQIVCFALVTLLLIFHASISSGQTQRKTPEVRTQSTNQTFILASELMFQYLAEAFTSDTIPTPTNLLEIDAPAIMDIVRGHKRDYSSMRLVSIDIDQSYIEITELTGEEAFDSLPAVEQSLARGYQKNAGAEFVAKLRIVGTAQDGRLTKISYHAHGNSKQIRLENSISGMNRLSFVPGSPGDRMAQNVETQLFGGAAAAGNNGASVRQSALVTTLLSGAGLLLLAFAVAFGIRRWARA